MIGGNEKTPGQIERGSINKAAVCSDTSSVWEGKTTKQVIKNCHKTTQIKVGDSSSIWETAVELYPQGITKLFVFSSDSEIEYLSAYEKIFYPRMNIICNKYCGLTIKSDSLWLENIEVRTLRTLKYISSRYVLHTIKMCKCKPFVGLASFKICFNMVRCLEISYSHLQEKDMKALADTVSKPSFLEKVDLSGNNLSKSGAHIAHLIMASPQLGDLTLEESKLISSDISEMYDSLESEKYIHHKLLMLSLCNNRLSGCGPHVARLMTRLTLQKLYLPHCGLSNKDFKDVTEAVLCGDPVVSYLQFLNISDNELTDVDTLLNLVEHRPQELTSIMAQNNGFGDRLLELTERNYVEKLEELRLCGFRQDKTNETSVPQIQAGLTSVKILSVFNNQMSKDKEKKLNDQLRYEDGLLA